VNKASLRYKETPSLFVNIAILSPSAFIEECGGEAFLSRWKRLRGFVEGYSFGGFLRSCSVKKPER